MAATAAPAGNRRDRTRAATIEEIKDTALRLMRERGTTEVGFADIARAMGVTAPALYRYFADRDALLTALIADAWNDLATVLTNAATRTDRTDPNGGLLAVATAYRNWAQADPPRFTLIFGLPIPGYQIPEDANTRAAAARSRASLEHLLRAAITGGVAHPPLTEHVDQQLAQELDHLGRSAEPAIPANAYQGLLQAWMAIHGFICIEVYDHYNDLPLTSRDALFHSQVDLAARAMGLS